MVFRYLININDPDFRNIAIAKKPSYKNIFMYLIRYKLLCTTKPLSIVFHEINRCIKDYEESKYLILIPANEKDKGLLTKHLKKYLIQLSTLFKRKIIQMIMRKNNWKSKLISVMT